MSRILLLICALLAAVPATASAAPAPKVTSVAPLHLKVGDRLTIRGKGFLAGKNRNTVIFKATGARAVFAKAQSATKTKVVVKVPAKLLSFLKVRNGQSVATRFQIRVLAKRLSPSYTPAGKSPVIAPAAAEAAATPAPVTITAPAPPAAVTPVAAAPAAPAPPVVADCDHDGKPDASDADDDNDLLPDVIEAQIGTNPCSADTDGDGVSDAFEYESALDLNGRNLHFPSNAVYPDPNNSADANFDFDGDGLSLSDEYTLWMHDARGHSITPGGLMSYSDGDQDSTGDDNASTTPAAGSPLDRNGDGVITDDEKDIDNDGLTNWEERHGPMLIEWWGDAYNSEAPFAFQPGAAALYETNWLVADTDGDRVADGLDDQDHDGFTNVEEVDRDASGLWVNPYNPCLPKPTSATCSLHPPVTNAWAPFDGQGRLPTTLVYDGSRRLTWPQPS